MGRMYRGHWAVGRMYRRHTWGRCKERRVDASGDVLFGLMLGRVFGHYCCIRWRFDVRGLSDF